MPRDITVTIKVLEGLRPSRPDTIPVDHDLWRLLQDCWQATPGDRPSISQIIQRLDSIIGTKSEDAVADWDESISSKSRRSLQEWPLLPSIAAIERLILGKGVFCLACAQGITYAHTVCLRIIGIVKSECCHFPRASD
jgi:hypothetical protein